MMTEKETNFINFYYNEVQLKGNRDGDTINKAYSILFGENPTDNCGVCIKNRKQKLDNTYISLIKVQSPVKYEDVKVDFIENKKSQKIKTIEDIPTLKNNKTDDFKTI